MAATFIKQSSTFKQGRSTSLRHAAAAIVGHETTEVAATNTFLTWCTSDVAESTFATIVSALYYLPQNFMLMLPRSIASASWLTGMISGSAAVKSQIQYYDNEDSSKDGSFSLKDADAVIGGDEDNHVAIMPANKYSEFAAKDFSFAVGRSPEAIASALLKLARDE
ncbi:MAG TPA: hypothetical protein VLG47_04370 [Candidatus Saccharimonadales bacterium]|nr:hypothetical protein [Candidatus Saccharimonadales bacterium]